MSEQRGTSKVSRSGGWITRVFLWLFVFLLCVSGAAGYYFGLPFVSNLLAEKEMITESVQALKVENANLAKTIPAQIETAIGSRLTKLTQQQSEEIARLNDEVGRLVSSERRLLTALSRTEAQLTRLSGVDQTAGRVAEAEFNVRMASQRLQAANDVSGAVALLRAADQLLQGIDTNTSTTARRSIASDIATLAAIPRVDRVGLLSQLQALEEQTQRLELVSISLPSAGANPQALDEKGSSEVSLLQQAAGVLQSYFVVTTLETSEARPLPDDWALLVKASLSAAYEQARLALLMNDQANFSASLSRIKRFVLTHSVSGDARAESIMRSLTDLSSTDISPVLPDISGTERALRGESSTTLSPLRSSSDDPELP